MSITSKPITELLGERLMSIIPESEDKVKILNDYKDKKEREEKEREKEAQKAEILLLPDYYQEVKRLMAEFEDLKQKDEKNPDRYARRGAHKKIDLYLEKATEGEWEQKYVIEFVEFIEDATLTDNYVCTGKTLKDCSKKQQADIKARREPLLNLKNVYHLPIE